MKVISIGDLVTDFYYKEGKLVGVNGGMSSHNIIANIAKQGLDTAVYGACGNDILGKVAIKSLSDLKIDVENIKIIDDIKTRRFHVSYFYNNEKLTFTSKKRCPICNEKKWYDESKIDVKSIIDKLDKEDILVFDNLNNKNQIIIDEANNKKMLDLGQYFELENYTDEEIVNKIKNKFHLINLNERVEKYLKDRFSLKSLEEIYNLLNAKMIIVTRGNKGSDFIFNNQVITKELISPSLEVDSTGAGDAFFSVFIVQYIKNKFIINKDFIDTTFLLATKLTRKVVKSFGARGHLQNLYKIKKEKESCTCDNFKILIRKKIKRCNLNINNLQTRTRNALKSNAYNTLKTIDFKNINNAILVGTGGSYAAATFASVILNEVYKINTIPMYPRSVQYRNLDKVDKLFLFSYSGTTEDILEGCKKINNKNKYIITKGDKQKITTKLGIPKENIISYRSSTNKVSERGFLSFEGVVSPSVLFLNLYLEKENIDIFEFVKDTFLYWDTYFKEYFKENKEILKNILQRGNIFNIFTGDYVQSAVIDLESKIIESGIYNVLIHEKKNFSHGRFINYEHVSQKINIYLRQKNISTYEEKLISYLQNDNTLIIKSRYNGILCEFDLLIASQYLVYYIANFINIDISKPTYSEDSMKIYFYKGEL